MDALSAKLGCPVIRTVSTSAEGLKTVVETAVARANESQLAPYSEGNIDLTDKKAVENADRERFDFVNKIVSKVETRKVLTKDKNSDDRIDAVLTNPVAGILIFAGIMFLVFQISQAWVGPLIADTLDGLAGDLPGLGGHPAGECQPLAVRLAGGRCHRRRVRPLSASCLWSWSCTS